MGKSPNQPAVEPTKAPAADDTAFVIRRTPLPVVHGGQSPVILRRDTQFGVGGGNNTQTRLGHIEFQFQFATPLQRNGAEFSTFLTLRFGVVGNYETGEVEILPPRDMSGGNAFALGFPPLPGFKAAVLQHMDVAVESQRNNPAYTRVVALWTAFRLSCRFGSAQPPPAAIPMAIAEGTAL